MRRPLSVVLLALALAMGCDRPLLDETPPDLAVVSPDLGEVQVRPDVTLRVSAQALRGVERVRIGGLDATFDPVDEAWEADVFLSRGTNPIVLEAFATDGTATRDTAFVVFAPLTVVSPAVNVLPEARAGLSATRLGSGGVLLAGGTGAGGVVFGTARLLTEADLTFSVGEALPMQRARTGHTASLLLDGRVLLLGGTSTPVPTPTSFVSEPEVFNPATRTTRPVVVRGDTPILRTHHVTTVLTLNGRQYLYVSGGQTPGTSSLLTTDAVDIAEWRPGADADTLITLTPDGGGVNGTPMPDPAQVVVGTRIREVTTVVAGLSGSTSDARRVRYTAPGVLYPFGINPATVPAPLVPRTAADGALAGSLALLVGGQSTSGETLSSIEAYTDAGRRWVRFPASVALGTPRRDHAVTLAPSGRILALGGRGPSGQPLSTLDVLSF